MTGDAQGATTPIVRGDGLLAPLLGRAAELSVVEGWLAHGERIVTISGPPGIGKTTLARSVLAASEANGSRAIFCDLTDARTDEDLCARMTVSLGPPADGGEGARGSPSELLAGLGDAVVVLDNFEQLVDTCRDRVRAWTVAAPRVRFVVTSRALLGAAEERSIELAPLALPARGELTSDAVEMFLACVRRAAFDYAPTPAELTSIAEITRRLDGIPLAIELAAARCRLLGPVSLLARLDRPLEVLGSRRGGDRERTLRGAIDWSWSLLDASEQRTLAQLAVFRGAFDVEAAEAVVVVEAGGPNVLDLLDALRDKGLLWSRRTDDGGARLGLYLAIRQFAEERLDASAGTLASSMRHARHYVETAGARRGGDDENLVAAVARTLEVQASDPTHGAEATALALAGATALALRVGRQAGPRSSDEQAGPRRRRGFLDAALARATSADPELRVRALRARARLRTLAGAVRDAADDCRTALALVGEDGGTLRASTLTDLGNAEAYLGRFESAREHFEAAFGPIVAAGDRRAEASIAIRAARCAIEVSKHDEATKLLARARTLAHESVASDLCASTFFGAVLKHDRCELGPAFAAYGAALEQARAGGDRFYEAASRLALGMVRLEQARLDEAIAMLEAGSALAAELDARLAILGGAYLGAALASAGRLDDAESAFERCERLAPTMDIEALRVAASVLRGVLDVRRAAEVEPGDADAGLALRQAAQARVQRAREVRDGRAVEARSVDVRIALRILGGAMGADADEASGASQGLVVHVEGDWFQLGSAPRASFKGRPTLSRVLACLARTRMERPGKPVERDELVRAGWPGERLAAASARNRLNVALSTLRSMGLRDALLTKDDGYFLDARVAIRLVA